MRQRGSRRRPQHTPAARRRRRGARLPSSSWRGQPRPTKTICAPDARMPATTSASSSAVSARNGGEYAPAMRSSGTSSRSRRCKRSRTAACCRTGTRAVRGRGLAADVEHQRRTVDAVSQPRGVQRVERPAHGLPVRRDDLERVQRRSEPTVARGGRHAMDRRGGGDERRSALGRVDDGCRRLVVIDLADEHAGHRVARGQGRPRIRGELGHLRMRPTPRSTMAAVRTESARRARPTSSGRNTGPGASPRASTHRCCG